MKYWMSCSLVLAIFGLAGCMSQTLPPTFSGKIPITEIFSTSQSRMTDTQPSAVWGCRMEQIERFDPFLVEKLLAAYPTASPWDEESEGVLVVYMGRQPTGGYQLVLAEAYAQVRQGVAVVQVEWKRPDVGAIVTQVISSPCLVLKMPRKGLHTIKIMDQNGTVRTEAAVRE